jgi:mercuric ion transport protein
LLTAILS